MSIEASGETPPARTAASIPPVTLVIVPTRGWPSLRLGDLWEYRELLYFLTWRDVKVRYKQTVLGVAWAVLQPLLLMLIFVLLLGRVGGLSKEVPSDVPYPVFVFSGLVPWTLFAAGITAAAAVLVANTNLVTKVYFPRLILPIASAGSFLVDLLLSLVVLCRPDGVVRGLSGVADRRAAGAHPAHARRRLRRRDLAGGAERPVPRRSLRRAVPDPDLALRSRRSPTPSTQVRSPGASLYDLNPMVAVIEGFRWALLACRGRSAGCPLISVQSSRSPSSSRAPSSSGGSSGPSRTSSR